jgi:hypothetical protein
MAAVVVVAALFCSCALVEVVGAMPKKFTQNLPDFPDGKSSPETPGGELREICYSYVIAR